MNVLAFETCFGATSVALRWQSARGEWLLREAYEERAPSTGGLDGAAGHAERLLPMIEEVMAAARLGFDAIDRLAVTLGPGTFTGVRVGIAAARGLALKRQIPIVGLDTLTVMALRATVLLASTSPLEPLPRPVVVAVDARRGEVYLAAFPPDGGAPLISPSILPVADAVERVLELPQTPSQPLVVGSGGPILAALAPNRIETALPRLEPHARVLAQAAPALTPLKRAEPLYLRPPDAKPPGPSSTLLPPRPQPS